MYHMQVPKFLIIAIALIWINWAGWSGLIRRYFSLNSSRQPASLSFGTLGKVWSLIFVFIGLYVPYLVVSGANPTRLILLLFGVTLIEFGWSGVLTKKMIVGGRSGSTVITGKSAFSSGIIFLVLGAGLLWLSNAMKGIELEDLLH